MWLPTLIQVILYSHDEQPLCYNLWVSIRIWLKQCEELILCGLSFQALLQFLDIVCIQLLIHIHLLLPCRVWYVLDCGILHLGGFFLHTLWTLLMIKLPLKCSGFPYRTPAFSRSSSSGSSPSHCSKFWLWIQPASCSDSCALHSCTRSLRSQENTRERTPKLFRDYPKPVQESLLNNSLYKIN